MKKVQQVYQAVSSPVGDLQTYRAMPTDRISHLDPFLFLNHHGPQVYPANNSGLPFGPHPHRGFETLTFIYAGDVMHWDSNGAKSIIKSGGVQWMTAGSGLIHSEESSDTFKQEGGNLEVIQLWLNLPSHLKNISPNYRGLQSSEIPQISADGYAITLVSGTLFDVTGPISSRTDLTIFTLDISGNIELLISEKDEVLFYVVNGAISVNDTAAKTHHLVQFEKGEGKLMIQAHEPSRIIIGWGKPIAEPIVAYGPFVMNSEEEIQQAFLDYQDGKMGSWTAS